MMSNADENKKTRYRLVYGMGNGIYRIYHENVTNRGLDGSDLIMEIHNTKNANVEGLAHIVLRLLGRIKDLNNAYAEISDIAGLKD
jgi:hypothetical protein